LPQQQFELPSRLVKFYSRDEIVKFLKALLEGYRKEAEKYGDALGTLMRTNPQEAAKIDPKGKTISKGWMKVGSLMVNVSDPSQASTEVMIQVHDDIKLKLASATTALSSFEQGANSVIPENMIYLLFLRNGIPERIIAQNPDAKRETFAFSASYKVI
jgi:hypothetical protein